MRGNICPVHAARRRLMRVGIAVALALLAAVAAASGAMAGLGEVLPISIPETIDPGNVTIIVVQYGNGLGCGASAWRRTRLDFLPPGENVAFDLHERLPLALVVAFEMGYAVAHAQERKDMSLRRSNLLHALDSVDAGAGGGNDVSADDGRWFVQFGHPRW